ncbi:MULTISPECIES: relaxase/mobilization nuclease domain-containing protein [unclassified Exiguobacterium]|uniref:relaxase/mobilization nuclease domain-containing protein n=1 Tax=unclassified Exiguobacterium TaxID=2644629 RepID=UPI001AE1C96F|nr:MULTISPECIES: relaxase/mobilization nuclease domain-containing protein [unclassified Exiguobacterium]
MATIQLGNTKVANKLISYAEKRAEERSGVDCPPEYTKSQMKATRELWGKPDGIQAHHVIQSFKPGEVTAKQANEIGQELARAISKGHEAVIYTHTDKEHIHNHIIINAVNFESGSKYQSSKKDLHRIREESDRLCQERGLSVIVKKDAPVRYTLAEKALLEKGKTSWKDEIRTNIEESKASTNSYDEFKVYLLKAHNIEVRERGNTTTYYDHTNKKRVRDNKLGADYEREVIKDGFERPIEGERTGIGEVGRHTGVSHGERAGSDTTPNTGILDSERTGASDAPESRRGLSVDRPAGGRPEGDDVPTGNRESRSDQQGHRRSDEFDYEEFNRKLEQSKQGTRKAYQQHKRTITGIDRNLLEPTQQEPASPSRAAEEHTEYTPRAIERQPQADHEPTQANEREGQQQHHRATKRAKADTREQHTEDRDRHEQSQEQARTTAKRNINRSFEQDFER